MAFHWASLTAGNLVGLPGVHEDRQSAEGFVLEFHVLSKPLSQKARKCPIASVSLSVIAGSDKRSHLLQLCCKTWFHLAMQGSDIFTSLCSPCHVGAEHPDRYVGGQSHT